ncbi:mucin-2-like isoform X2 [Hydractinia symbiolongicarpus]|uniref:mucin-2-like isoform X2 n=1 Tax=Hydractinia symbiolongicarpus TaxID=13093 RepID=UPI002551AE3C|nr:mucin-2-like isoform X2 [Hydractinia symbiolongicarpus]
MEFSTLLVTLLFVIRYVFGDADVAGNISTTLMPSSSSSRTVKDDVKTSDLTHQKNYATSRSVLTLSKSLLKQASQTTTHSLSVIHTTSSVVNNNLQTSISTHKLTQFTIPTTLSLLTTHGFTITTATSSSNFNGTSNMASFKKMEVSSTSNVSVSTIFATTEQVSTDISFSLPFSSSSIIMSTRSNMLAASSEYTTSIKSSTLRMESSTASQVNTSPHKDMSTLVNSQSMISALLTAHDSLYSTPSSSETTFYLTSGVVQTSQSVLASNPSSAVVATSSSVSKSRGVTYSQQISSAFTTSSNTSYRMMLFSSFIPASSKVSVAVTPSLVSKTHSDVSSISILRSSVTTSSSFIPHSSRVILATAAPSNQSPHYTTAEKVGIGFAIAVGIILFCLIIWFVRVKRRDNKHYKLYNDDLFQIPGFTEYGGTVQLSELGTSEYEDIDASHYERYANQTLAWDN